MSFECVVCGKEISGARIDPLVGPYCLGFYPPCWIEAKRRRKAKIDEARNLDLDSIPETCGMEEFEDLSLSVAVHVVDHIRESAKDEDAKDHEVCEAVMRNNPFVLAPSEMALDVKEKVLPYLRDYVGSELAVGHERIFHGGTFWFEKEMPRDAMLKAFGKAGYLSERDGDD